MDEQRRKFLRMQHVHRQNSQWVQQLVADDPNGALKLLGAIADAQSFDDLERMIEVTDGVTVFQLIKALAFRQIMGELVRWGQMVEDGDIVPKISE